MKKVLVCGDSSIAESGFAQYNRQILHALHNNPECEVAEFAFSGTVEQKHLTPWKFYATAVNGKDQRYKQFVSNHNNRYGAWRFESVVLHFQPDVVLSTSDPWHIAYQALSPVRPYFHWCLCPTVDSHPQKPEFLQLFHEADSVLTYTDYGKKVLEDWNIKVDGVISMGIDASVFKPVPDKKAHKKALGIPEDSIVFGFVCRNQIRKRIPELMDAFKIYLNSVDKDTADRSYLYLHTTYPDQGIDIPTVLLENGLFNKIFFTYICQETHKWFPAFFQDSATHSPFAKQKTALLPNVMRGVSQEQLSEVYNCMDVYIQWAVCEGFGATVPEAAACGLPVVAVNYSAMGEVAPSVGGETIAPLDLQYDMQVGARRAVMDNQALANKMVEWSKKVDDVDPEIYRNKVINKYSWGEKREQWVQHILNTPPINRWGTPPVYMELPEKFEQQMTVTQFVHTLYQSTHSAWKYNVQNLIRYLNYGFQVNGPQVSPVTPDTIYNAAKTYANLWNQCQNIRIGKTELKIEDFLQ
jgi:glycosyltransferase involved in cell wall biosynthesis